MVFWRPTARGSTPPGKKTELRNGRMGSTAGMSALLMVPGGTIGAAITMADWLRSLSSAIDIPPTDWLRRAELAAGVSLVGRRGCWPASAVRPRVVWRPAAAWAAEHRLRKRPPKKAGGYPPGGYGDASAKQSVQAAQKVALSVTLTAPVGPLPGSGMKVAVRVPWACCQTGWFGSLGPSEVRFNSKVPRWLSLP